MIRRTVFGSKSEKELFNGLHSRWSSQFDLWPSLPFCQIIDIQSLSACISNKERDFLYKTSVDFTLCTKAGAPVLSIEFDGLGKGYSRKGEYIIQEESKDPYRKLKLDLKLKIAHKDAYPFYVISFEESNSISHEINLTIVDGIIGQVLAKKEFHKSIETLYEDNKDNIESLPVSSQHDYIQDLVLDAETLAELNWDPIAMMASKLMYEAYRKGIIKGMQTEYLCDPAPPKGDPFQDIAILEARINTIKNAIRVGCRIVAKTPIIAIIETIWLRNFEDTIISPIHIASNIAELLVAKRALEYNSGK